MWKQKELKSKSKAYLSRNYKRTIAVCFIVAILAAAFTTSTRFISTYNHEEKISKNVIEVMGVQSSAYSVVKLVQDVQNDMPKHPKDIVNINRIGHIADVTLNPNSATINVVKIADRLIVEGFGVPVFFLIVGFILKVFYNIFISAALNVGEKRFFLENRVYSKTAIYKVFYLFWLRHVRHTAGIMFVRRVKQFLWNFTIVGGIIKYYEYSMIPYIIAENPEISLRNAFLVSREMMKGNKLKALYLDLSFIGWHILNIVSISLVNLFFLEAYRQGVWAELYMVIRNEKIALNADYACFYTDTYLEHDEDFVSAHENTYPYEHYIIPKKPFVPIVPDRKYDITSLILFFFIFSVAGWLFEAGMHLIGDGVFVNRGTMQGPWLPIFGTGGLFVVLFMRKTIDKPIFTFLTIATVCCAIEYVVSVYLEETMGVRWWDYSEYFMNFEGRICLYGALLFGFGGCAFLYYIAPRLDDAFKKIPRWIKIVVCIVLCLLFIRDGINSYNEPNMGAGITDYELK